jgi:WD40 repeat protein
VLAGHAVNTEVLDCAWSPDGRRIVSAGTDATVKSVECGSSDGGSDACRARRSGHGCVYLPDGASLVSTGADGLVVVWDAESGHPRAILVLPESLGCVAGHPSAECVAVGSDAGNVYVLDLVGGGSRPQPLTSHRHD